MTSVFIVVAMLCQLNVQMDVGSRDIELIEQKQLECHKYYAACIQKNSIYTFGSDTILAKCIVRK